MIVLFIMLILWLGPCGILIYNKEIKKGLFFFAASVGMLVAYAIWASRIALAYVPASVAKVDSALLQEITKKHIIPDHSGIFYTYQFILLGLWVCAIAAAFMSVMQRRKQKTDAPAASDE